ncbi:MAG: DNA-binding transcriptional activator HyfR [Verrucomicrobia subdivision 3 bacterium]|nr:DNA-binding transcriptional activator HyfR [Limisphaerales bacterium]MCS1412428.1 DNA-binding transcriptional activator HyfR [Limisphaerales bacterium]
MHEDSDPRERIRTIRIGRQNRHEGLEEDWILFLFALRGESIFNPQFSVELPLLRKRKDDIPLLGRHFVNLFVAEIGQGSPPIIGEALTHLSDYRFPGNIRGLKTMMERAVIKAGNKAIPDLRGCHHRRAS